MRNPLVCDAIDPKHAPVDMWWSNRDKPDPANEKEAAAMQKMFVLGDKLLSFGGKYTCLPLYEEDYEKIMSRGQFFYGKGAHFSKGEDCHCHSNSAYLWDANRGRCRIATGYALSADGIWRQHTWVVQPLTTKYRVWETTVKRIGYYGVVLTDDECEVFLAQQS